MSGHTYCTLKVYQHPLSALPVLPHLIHNQLYRVGIIAEELSAGKAGTISATAQAAHAESRVKVYSALVKTQAFSLELISWRGSTEMDTNNTPYSVVTEAVQTSVII